MEGQVCWKLQQCPPDGEYVVTCEAVTAESAVSPCEYRTVSARACRLQRLRMEGSYDWLISVHCQTSDALPIELTGRNLQY